MNPANRPLLRIPYSPMERNLEIASAAGLAFGLLTIVQSWSSIPDSIPTHFGFSGRPDAWGAKRMLLLFPIVSVVLYAGLTAISRYPHLYNYPWPITEQNAQRQYQLARSLLCGLKVEMIWLFTFLEWKTVQVALGKAEGLGAVLLWVWLVVIFGTIGIYVREAYRAR